MKNIIYIYIGFAINIRIRIRIGSRIRFIIGMRPF
jgi:hypothetical protein